VQLEANLSFALATYELFATSTPPSASILHAPAFALKRFCEQRPQDATALHLYALIAERLGQYDLALGQLTKAVSVLEAAYEVSEDVEVEAKFAIAQSNLGRLRLASGEYQLAVEAFAGTLGLIDAADDSVQSRRVRVHAKFGSGLAHYWLGELDESLSMFQAALDELETKPMGRMKDQVSVLLAQALWAMGGEEEKDAAKNTLLEWCVLLLTP
jgi:superkiller protein 3